MRLGINLLPYSPHQQGGAEVYLRNLLRAVANMPTRPDIVLFVTPKSRGLYRFAPDFEEVVLPGWSERSRIDRVTAEQLVMPFLLRQKRIDVLFSNYVCPILFHGTHIVNIHDLLYKRFPDTFERAKLIYWRLFIPLSARKSRAVMTVSQFSASELVKFFPDLAPRIHITVEGVKPEIYGFKAETGEHLRSHLGVQGPYILSAATFAPHKNLSTLIKGFSMFHRDYPHVNLVLTGAARRSDANEALVQLRALINYHEITKSVLFTGYVSDEELAALYQGAVAHVVPSKYEGFGLSVIEAQACGCPVIVSSAGSLPEIGGCTALCFDGDDPQQLYTHLLSLIKSPSFSESLVTAGFRNLNRFGWDKSAFHLIKVAEQVYTGW